MYKINIFQFEVKRWKIYIMTRPMVKKCGCILYTSTACLQVLSKVIPVYIYNEAYILPENSIKNPI